MSIISNGIRTILRVIQFIIVFVLSHVFLKKVTILNTTCFISDEVLCKFMFNQNKYLNGIYPGAVAVTVGIYIPTIFINSVFTSYHQDIQNAIIAHELGHIHHNDLSLQNLRDATIINGMIIDIDMECRADAYAATLTSKELMLNVLTILRPLDSDGIEYRINKLLDK